MPSLLRAKDLRYLFYLGILFFTLLMLIPVYILAKISLSKPEDVLMAYPPFGVYHPTLKHWQRVFTSGYLWQPFSMSMSVATGTTILALLIAPSAAYVISRRTKRVKYSLILMLFFTRMFPEVGIALSVAVAFIRLNLLDTRIGLILAHLIRILPLATWILVGVFETIPKDLEEAAMVDGCGRASSLLHVVLPLSLPGISVSAIFAWLESWNEFTYALYLCLTKKTLPLQTYYYIIRGNWFDSAAYATILVVPVVIVTYALQRYLQAGYLVGAVKG